MSKRRRRRNDKQRRHQRPAPTRRRLALGVGLTISATLAAGGTAQATDFTVDSLGDEDDDNVGTGGCHTAVNTCTLRAAIEEANANSGPDNILFDSSLSGTITLVNGGALLVTGATDIQGPGAGQLSVSGNDAYRVFLVEQATVGNAVSISDLTLTNGESPGGGGAIYNSNANLTVSDVVVTDSYAPLRGGGVGSSFVAPSLTIERSTLSGNSTSTGGFNKGGGAIYAANELFLADSTIAGNTSQ